MALKTILAKMREEKKQYQQTQDAITGEMIAQMLGQHVPEGYVLVWGQATPYFNDGDPCYFRVREPILVEDPGELSEIDSPWRGDVYEAWTDELGEAWGEVYNETELLECAFGDHKMICVRRGGEWIARDYTDHD